MGLFDLWRRRKSGSRHDTDSAPISPSPHGGGASVSNDEAEARSAMARGDARTAIEYLQSAIDENPTSAELHCLLGSAYVAVNEVDDAADSYTLALHFDPTALEAYLGKGALLVGSGRLEEACTLFSEGLAHLPNAAALHCNLGLQLFEVGRPEEGLAACDVAIEIAPDLAEAWHNRGYIQLHLGNPQSAIESLDRALALRPELSETKTCRAHALRDLGRLDAAIALYEQILANNPRSADARGDLALAQLLAGQFDKGWSNYAWRFGAPGTATRGFPFRAWAGEPLGGKSILVFAEQGIGDEIMFASCLPDVLGKARRCVIECNTRLASLFARAFPDAEVHGAEKRDSTDWVNTLGAIDYQTAIGDLPRYLRPSRDRFPDHRGYLRADPARVARWRERLAALGTGPKIGVAWRGGGLKTRGRSRSIDLAALVPAIAGSRSTWISLQRAPLLEGENKLSTDLGIADCGLGEARDIEELAALIDALDWVVSVDTTVVHIAGALGKPISVLLPYSPDWRYGFEGRAMPWYPAANLLRQHRHGDWAPVISGLVKCMEALG